jgi:hypothetical protein
MTDSGSRHKIEKGATEGLPFRVKTPNAYEASVVKWTDGCIAGGGRPPATLNENETHSWAARGALGRSVAK